MNQELEKALQVLKETNAEAQMKDFELNDLFRNKINSLILRTPTGDLRNELTILNIIHEEIVLNNEILVNTFKK